MSKMNNRLGWVTSINFTSRTEYVDVTTVRDVNRMVVPGPSSIEFDISGVAIGTKGVFDLFQEWMHDGIYGPTFQQEFRCLYCTSPNPIRNTHCSQCGAPRSFVIG